MTFLNPTNLPSWNWADWRCFLFLFHVFHAKNCEFLDNVSRWFWDYLLAKTYFSVVCLFGVWTLGVLVSRSKFNFSFILKLFSVICQKKKFFCLSISILLAFLISFGSCWISVGFMFGMFCSFLLHTTWSHWLCFYLRFLRRRAVSFWTITWNSMIWGRKIGTHSALISVAVITCSSFC